MAAAQDPYVVDGKVWKFGDWINGDEHIVRFSDLGDFSGPQDERKLAGMCFAALDPTFARTVRAGDIVVGGRGFGIPSHPPVPLALRASGIAAVVVESSDSGFVRKSLNIGLPVLCCRGITDLVSAGDQLRVDVGGGAITNLTTGGAIRCQGFSPAMLAVLHAGGLVEHLRREVDRGALPA